MTGVDTQPDWAGTPPPAVWCAVVDAAEYAARDDGSRSCAAITDSGLDARALAIAAIRALAGIIAEGVPADDIREGVLVLASETGAADYTVTSALEAVAMAESLVRDDVRALAALWGGSHVSTWDRAIMACALTGQTIAALAGHDTPAIFNRLRAYGGAP